MKNVRVSVVDLGESGGTGKIVSMAAFEISRVQYCKWDVDNSEPENSPRRVVNARIKVEGLDRPIYTDVNSLEGTLKAMIGEV